MKMNIFTKSDLKLKDLFNIASAPAYTKTLFAGIELDVFSELEQPRNYAEIAEKLELHQENTKYLLDALTSMNILKKENGLYKNTELSSEYLVKSSESYIGSLLLAKTNQDINIAKLVKEGPPSEAEQKQGLKLHETLGNYSQIMKTAQKVVRASEISVIVSSVPEFCSFQKMLDLGGGPGLIGIEIVKNHPDLKCVIFDTSVVTKVAEESIKEYHLQDRIEVLSGDYMVDSIGEGYDFILTSGTLNFAKHDLDTVVKKIYNALNPKGIFMCISEGLTEEGTKPTEMIFNWLPNRLKGRDFGLKQGEISDSALRNGFKNVYKRTVNMMLTELDVDIARKDS
jgi:ubiquinone/menaquinone biosynthesis C-methylase UbiE